MRKKDDQQMKLAALRDSEKIPWEDFIPNKYPKMIQRKMNCIKNMRKEFRSWRNSYSR